MENILDVAQFLFDGYQRMSGERIDEMKLHKLLYFSQRESFAVTGKPLFEETLHGWKYGPVSPLVRGYLSDDGIVVDTAPVSDESAYLLNNVLAQYGTVASWKLSELSHEELSWKNARRGLAPNQKGNRALALDDIRKDAEKVRPYDSVWDMYYDEFEDEVEGAG